MPAAVEKLMNLHPQPNPCLTTCFIEARRHAFSPTIFDKLNGDSIRKAALRTQGAAGISGGRCRPLATHALLL